MTDGCGVDEPRSACLAKVAVHVLVAKQRSELHESLGARVRECLPMEGIPRRH